MPARIKEVHSQLHSFLYISTGPVCYCDVPIHSVFYKLHNFFASLQEGGSLI